MNASNLVNNMPLFYLHNEKMAGRDVAVSRCRRNEPGAAK